MAMNNNWTSKDGQVKKTIIEPGLFTRKPTEKTPCDVLIDQIQITTTPSNFPIEKLNSDYLTNPGTKSTITIGEACSLVDRNIERALQMMSLKEKSTVTLNLPPLPETENHNVDITFIVTLYSYKTQKQVWEWTEEEKYETALKYKDAGSALFRAGRHIDAFFKFSKACKLLITMEPLNKEEKMDEELVRKINNLRVVTYNNMAECHLHQKNYNHVIELCTKVLTRDEKNIKALYRRAVAFGSVRDWEKAYDDMKKVTESEPNNNAAINKLHLYEEQIKKANKKMDNIMKKMFVAIADD